MTIRNATYHDAPAIKALLKVLGYESRMSMLIHQLETMFDKNDHQVFVCERRGEIVGFASVHFLPQLAFDGGVAIISYLSVDDSLKGQGVDKALERYISEQAILKKCERIQVHLSEWRAAEQKFYEQQGYQEYPKYFTKRLVYAE
ncbi:GNAT family N-acetyltransferase [Mucilaginibacter ginsenosidivorans]|uniref:GNAT family N-acetyltransferase n=1 Tax=Mucilaginibacter ginsenosidivorans TaxID=398053 RepID=A0A5B8UTK5_9SPHI|nr:GNAT family N-acetyltransferase [Mucilaginibacter ginsenosidivorans]QEC62440.1 GNAT family N-acetyltransferase [Mucilaginibacter ginsenosidivorans]